MSKNTNTPLKNPVLRRFSQVYVEIPPSPLHRSRSVSIPNALHVSTTSANRKENTPLRVSNLFQIPTTAFTSSTNRKRKLSESTSNMVALSTSKKPKLISDTQAIDKPKATKFKISTNTSEEFPNGFFYCHQCAKKRDSTTGIHCTIRDVHHNRCKIKFCTPCLKNRQGEHVDEIKAAGKSQNSLGHVQHENYTWECPKCRDICNCSRCRKAKGLAPTGNLTIIARRTGAESAADMLLENPETTGIIPGKGTQITPAPKKPVVRKKVELTKASTSTAASDLTKQVAKMKAGVAAKPKPKPRPILKWSKVPIEGSLPLTEAERRIQIREFVLRFACIMDTKSVSRKLLEELEDIGGERSGSKGRARNEEDEEEAAGWVSEACVKGLVMGLLSLILSDEQNSADKKLIGNAIKNLRSSGVNLTKIWSILAVLRESITKSSTSSDAAKLLSHLPDPLLAPQSATYHNTRTTRIAGPNTVFVAQSSQMVPVLVALTEVVLKTEVIRTEIEEGVKEWKDKVREGKDGLKIENDRWEKEKEKDTKMPDVKHKRAVHKRTILDIDESLNIAMHAYAPRFGGLLGKDMDGRSYWTLSPGVTERDNAIQLVAESASECDKDTNGKRGKRTVPDEEEREGMKKWSWFVGVWGKKPLSNENVGKNKTVGKKANKRGAYGDDSDTSESDDEEAECWWGFWEPAEIKKVAEWIEIQADLDVGDKKETATGRIMTNNTRGQDSLSSKESSPLSAVPDTDPDLYDESASKEELKRLVKRLREYASMLEWRVGKDADANGKANGK